MFGSAIAQPPQSNVSPRRPMAQIEVEIPDDLLRQLGNEGKTPAEFILERLLTFSQQPTAQLQSEASITQKFRKLADQWQTETRHLSLVSDIVLNSAYQQIIGMGSAAVPLLLQELKKQPDHWFWALRSITGENPITPTDRGHLKKMSEAWLAWGKEHGYQC